VAHHPLQVLGGQVGEASVLLDDYNVRLQEELKDRKRVGSMISEFLSAQKDLLAQAEERLEQYQDKMDRYQGMREELNSHIAALPDIPVLPATTGVERLHHLYLLHHHHHHLHHPHPLHHNQWLLTTIGTTCTTTSGLAPLPSAGDLFTH